MARRVIRKPPSRIKRTLNMIVVNREESFILHFNPFRPLLDKVYNLVPKTQVRLADAMVRDLLQHVAWNAHSFRRRSVHHESVF